MYKVKVYTQGKVKEPWLHDALEEYTKRLKSVMRVDWVLLKDDKALILALQEEKQFVCLDIEGASLSSERFSQFVLSLGSRLVFVIGGATGIPEVIKKRASHLISLSPLTFTHQLVRLILIEQLYRALEIQKGTQYHK